LGGADEGAPYIVLRSPDCRWTVVVVEERESGPFALSTALKPTIELATNGSLRPAADDRLELSGHL